MMREIAILLPINATIELAAVLFGWLQSEVRKVKAGNMDRKKHWAIPSSDLSLSENQVHAWRVFLNAPLGVRNRLERILGEDERIRASRFYFESDQHRWIIARGALRMLISRYLHLQPEKLLFASNEYGKLALAPFHERKLEFNLSHSRDIALYVLTVERQVRVDVEYMRDDIAYDELAKVSFSPNERTILRSLPQAAKREAFFNCWTRKEAYIKARGLGLSLPLHLFDVSIRPSEPVALLASREDPCEVSRWTLLNLYPGMGYAAALAVEGTGWQLHCRQWL